MKKVAVRNLRLCTKDCLCLYVCKTGATDTENSIIDITKCVGCGDCADACPSKAISMVPLTYPPQQKKEAPVLDIARKLANMKAKEEGIATKLSEIKTDPNSKRFFKALSMATRLVNEDLIRESGYMLPQSNNAHLFLKDLIKNPPTKDFPTDVAKKLLDLIPNNEKKESKF